MTDDEFIEMFREIIQSDAEMTLDTPLEEIEEWDSMGIMAMIAHFDARYGMALNFMELAGLETIGDIAKLSPDFIQ